MKSNRVGRNIPTHIKNTIMIHEFVKNVRIKKGISQSKLAEKTGVRRAAICNFENGKVSLNSKTLELIFDELKIILKENKSD